MKGNINNNKTTVRVLYNENRCVIIQFTLNDVHLEWRSIKGVHTIIHTRLYTIIYHKINICFKAVKFALG